MGLRPHEAALLRNRAGHRARETEVCNETRRSVKRLVEVEGCKMSFLELVDEFIPLVADDSVWDWCVTQLRLQSYCERDPEALETAVCRARLLALISCSEEERSSIIAIAKEATSSEEGETL